VRAARRDVMGQREVRNALTYVGIATSARTREYVQASALSNKARIGRCIARAANMNKAIWSSKQLL
jgi:hypothetical protein